jgi:hypothetical protein
MRRSWKRAAWVAAVSLPLFGGVAARAQAPVAPAAPQTLWSWLGVPKPPMGGVINRQGNFPGCEKLPPLKKIADPANLASKNPAIKKAAEIKAEEDLAKQKIKAIKYLAEIGCGGCYPGVAEALAASLDDCTEEVRYEAVKAILSTSACGQDDCTKKCVRAAKSCHEATHDAVLACMKNGCAKLHMLCGKPGPDGATLKSKLGIGRQCGPNNQCQPAQCGRCGCGNGSCCNSEILNKLSTMAYERDDRGCWKEPSARVRAMAAQALRACRHNVRPYADAPMPAPEEVPVTPESGKTPETGSGRTPETTGPQGRPAVPEAVQPKSSSTEVEGADQVAAHVESLPVIAVAAEPIMESVMEPVMERVAVAVVEPVPAPSPAPAADELLGQPGAVAPVVPVRQVEERTAADVGGEVPVAPSPDDLVPIQVETQQRPAQVTTVQPARVRAAAARPFAGFFRGR